MSDSERWQAEINSAVKNASDVLQEKQRLLEKRIRQHDEKEANMESDIKRRRDETLADVEQQRRELEEEKKAMENVHKFQSSRITLNVGGIRFQTSRSTLTKEPNTMLAAMFSGRHELIPDEEGAYFIDRDGTHFRHILNFLRDSDLACLPTDSHVLEELLREGQFYQIERLSAIINKVLRPQLSQREVDLRLEPMSKYQTTIENAVRITVDTKIPDEGCNFDRQVISDVSFTRVYFNKLSCRSSVLRNVSFKECCFYEAPVFTRADLTNVSFRQCYLRVAPIMFQASRDGVTFDVQGFKEKLRF